MKRTLLGLALLVAMKARASMSRPGLISAGFSALRHSGRMFAMKTILQRGLLGLAVAAAFPTAALADDTCNGFINIDYVNGLPVNNIGDTVDVKITFGTGSIQGGTKLPSPASSTISTATRTFP